MHPMFTHNNIRHLILPDCDHKTIVDYVIYPENNVIAYHVKAMTRQEAKEKFKRGEYENNN